MSHHIGLQVLRAKLRGFQAAGCTIASRITRSQKERKTRLWESKRRLGLHCRYHLVAYGLLREVPYERIERCAVENKLDPQVLLDIMLAHASRQQKGTLNLESVKRLLGSMPEQPTPSMPTSPPAEGLLARARRLLEKRA